MECRTWKQYFLRASKRGFPGALKCRECYIRRDLDCGYRGCPSCGNRSGESAPGESKSLNKHGQQRHDSGIHTDVEQRARAVQFIFPDASTLIGYLEWLTLLTTTVRQACKGQSDHASGPRTQFAQEFNVCIVVLQTVVEESIPYLSHRDIRNLFQFLSTSNSDPVQWIFVPNEHDRRTYVSFPSSEDTEDPATSAAEEVGKYIHCLFEQDDRFKELSGLTTAYGQGRAVRLSASMRRRLTILRTALHFHEHVAEMGSVDARFVLLSEDARAVSTLHAVVHELKIENVKPMLCGSFSESLVNEMLKGDNKPSHEGSPLKKQPTMDAEDIVHLKDVHEKLETDFHRAYHILPSGEVKKNSCDEGAFMSDSQDQIIEHWSVNALRASAKRREILRGRLKVEKHCPREAYVIDGESGTKVLVLGRRAQNRAFHGDIVGVRLLPQNQWLTRDSVDDKLVHYTEDEELSDKIPGLNERQDASSHAAKPDINCLKGDLGDRVPTGAVVGIFSRGWRPYVCTVLPETMSSKGVEESEGGEGPFDGVPGIANAADATTSAVLAVPMDIRIPKIRLRSRQTKLLWNKRIVVVVDGWERSSQYPHGHYVHVLGPAGSFEPEVSALLVEHGIDEKKVFSEAALACLPPLASSCPPWGDGHTSAPTGAPTISACPIRAGGSNIAWQSLVERHAAGRKDLRGSHRVFSVDPIGCRDIDDAMSVRLVQGSWSDLRRTDAEAVVVEVGVHIADVTAFVQEASVLDREAAARATTVYLPHRRFDMLPALLSSDLCSLHSHIDRLAVSTFFYYKVKRRSNRHEDGSTDEALAKLKKEETTDIRDEEGLENRRGQRVQEGRNNPPCAQKQDDDWMQQKEDEMEWTPCSERETWFGRTVIHSTATLTYEQADELLQGQAPSISPRLHRYFSSILHTSGHSSPSLPSATSSSSPTSSSPSSSTTTPASSPASIAAGKETGEQIVFEAGGPVSKDLHEGLRRDLALLRSLARTLRKNREASGGVELSEGHELHFELTTNGEPVDLEEGDDLEVHHTIAELMIMTNCAVAERIYQSFPSTALLRRHSPPPKERFAAFMHLARSVGVSVKIDSNKDLGDTLREIRRDLERTESGRALLALFNSMAVKAMTQAEYVSSGAVLKQQESMRGALFGSKLEGLASGGDDGVDSLRETQTNGKEEVGRIDRRSELRAMFGHYGLGVTLYTHFTSPIRRYADVIVHRLLLRAISGEGEFIPWLQAEEGRHDSLLPPERKPSGALVNAGPFNLAPPSLLPSMISLSLSAAPPELPPSSVRLDGDFATEGSSKVFVHRKIETMDARTRAEELRVVKEGESILRPKQQEGEDTKLGEGSKEGEEEDPEAELWGELEQRSSHVPIDNVEEDLEAELWGGMERTDSHNPTDSIKEDLEAELWGDMQKASLSPSNGNVEEDLEADLWGQLEKTGAKAPLDQHFSCLASTTSPTDTEKVQDDEAFLQLLLESDGVQLKAEPVSALRTESERPFHKTKDTIGHRAERSDQATSQPSPSSTYVSDSVTYSKTESASGGLARAGKSLTAESLASLAQHLNDRNLNAKEIARECEGLFLTLYLRHKGANAVKLRTEQSDDDIIGLEGESKEERKATGHPQKNLSSIVTRGVVFSLKKNGVLIYLPKFNVRGPLYLCDKQGNVQVPPSLLNFPSNMVKGLPPCSPGFEPSPGARVIPGASIELMKQPTGNLHTNVTQTSRTGEVRETKRGETNVATTLGAESIEKLVISAPGGRKALTLCVGDELDVVVSADFSGAKVRFPQLRFHIVRKHVEQSGSPRSGGHTGLKKKEESTKDKTHEKDDTDSILARVRRGEAVESLRDGWRADVLGHAEVLTKRESHFHSDEEQQRKERKEDTQSLKPSSAGKTQLVSFYDIFQTRTKPGSQMMKRAITTSTSAVKRVGASRFIYGKYTTPPPPRGGRFGRHPALAKPNSSSFADQTVVEEDFHAKVNDKQEGQERRWEREAKEREARLMEVQAQKRLQKLLAEKRHDKINRRNKQR